MLFVFFALITIGAITLQKTYGHIPNRELRRRARDGDDLAKLLHRATAYGDNLEFVLWVVIGLSATGFFILVDRSLPSWAAMIASLLLLWLGFAWLPYTRVSKLAIKFASVVTPALAWVLQRIYPVINPAITWANKRRLGFHTGLYEKEDLLDVVSAQSHQQDSRFSHEELLIAKSALTFGDKIVRDIMVPFKSVLSVPADEAVGPVLLTELHKKGHQTYPVHQKGKKTAIIGTLYMRDLHDGLKEGSVEDLMRPRVYFMHDEMRLDQALGIFLKSKHHLFVVVNSFEDTVGVVTIEDVVEQLIGHQTDDEFDSYDDKKAVAKHSHRKKHTDTVPTDVVESNQDEEHTK